MSIVPEMKKIEKKGIVLEQMCNNRSTTTSNNNQKQTLLVYKKYFLLCQSCSWHVSYQDLSGKLGNISGEEYIRCPICKIGRIITESQSDV
jgi:formamidopyrimidine-DNA glycosylase